MLRFFFKSFSAFALALLIYFVLFQQACSQVTLQGGIGCDAMSPDSNCRMEIIPPERTQIFVPPDRPQEDLVRPQEDFVSEEPADIAIEPPRIPRCRFSYEMSLGLVDIIFVVDNSGSMAFEHRKLAEQFKSFLSDIKNVDYHIAIITTEISPDNSRTYYQNGQFIPINGQAFLRNPALGEEPPKALVRAFQSAIEREETLACEEYKKGREEEEVDSQSGAYSGLFANSQSFSSANPCPESRDDERGTYALNLAFQNPNQRSFFRGGAQKMFVFLSDEDIRGGADYYNQWGYEDYRPEYQDTPESVFETFFSVFGATSDVRAFTIIIPPGNRRCLREQNDENDQSFGAGGRGYEGEQYARLSRPDEELRSFLFSNNLPVDRVLEGSVISICDRRYGSQLQNVAVSAKEMKIPTPCSNPEAIRLFVNDRGEIDFNYEIEGTSLLVEPNRDLRLSSRVHVELICEGAEVCSD